MNTLYTAVATANGGRRGTAASESGQIDVKIAIPQELGGNGEGTNPEELFAAGYAACFGSALQTVAAMEKKRVKDVSITARVGLGQLEGGRFGLEVKLEALVPGLEQGEAEELVAKAHKACPYSNATRGNIPVELEVRVSEPAGTTP